MGAFVAGLAALVVVLFVFVGSPAERAQRREAAAPTALAGSTGTAPAPTPATGTPSQPGQQQAAAGGGGKDSSRPAGQGANGEQAQQGSTGPAAGGAANGAPNGQATSRAEQISPQGAAIARNGTEAGATPCSGCHQEDGSGNPDAGAPRLAGQIEPYLRKQLADYASGKRKNEIMEPIAQALKDDEKASTAAYYAHLQAPATPAADQDAAKIERGALLARTGSAAHRVQACQNCHGPAGSGLAPSYPALAGQSETYLRAQYEAWRQGTRANDPESVMRTIFSLLGEDDVDAVGAYFASRQPPSVIPAQTAAAQHR